MPRDPATGVFTLASNSFSDPIDNTVIDPVDAKSTFNDFVSGLNSEPFIAPVEQNITGAGPIAVGATTNIVRVNQTVGAPITLTMGLSSAQKTPVLIVDWKGDAGTNNITITLTGADKFQANLTTWIIASDGGSVFLRPIPGVGYAL